MDKKGNVFYYYHRGDKMLGIINHLKIVTSKIHGNNSFSRSNFIYFFSSPSYLSFVPLSAHFISFFFLTFLSLYLLFFLLQVVPYLNIRSELKLIYFSCFSFPLLLFSLHPVSQVILPYRVSPESPDCSKSGENFWTLSLRVIKKPLSDIIFFKISCENQSC